MSSGFDPLGFGSSEGDMIAIMQDLERASDTLGELRRSMQFQIGQCIESCLGQLDQMTQRITAPIGESVIGVDATVDALSRQIRNDVQFRLGQASELFQQLESQIRIAGQQPPEIMIPPGAGDGIAIGGPPEIMIPPGAGTPVQPTPPGGDEPENGLDEEIAIDMPPDETVNGNGNGGELPGNGNGNGGGPGNGNGDGTGNGGPISGDGPGQDGQQCPPQQTHTVCPAPVVSCPDPPDVTVNVPPCPSPFPPGEQTGEEQPGDVTEVPPAIEVKGRAPQCEIDAYDPAKTQPPYPVEIDTHTPLQSLLVPEIDDIDAAIAESEQERSWFSPIKSFWLSIRISYLMWIRMLDRLSAVFASLTGCESPRYLTLQAWRVLAYFGALLLGPALSKPDRQAEYESNALCPVEFPDHNEATEAYVRGTIDRKTYELWLKQNDRCLEPWEKITEARMDRVEPLMALQMWKRGFISEEEFNKQIRKNGYNKLFRDSFSKLGDFIPPITDLVRFMVRDTADEELVKEFGMDDGFPDPKYAGKVKEWAEQQGITEDAARQYWRAHWRIPSPTQLFDMFHRTRHLPDDDPLKTTREMVETALKQDDLLPFWVPRMIDRTFAIPTRRDARRQFETGAITADQLRQNLIKSGYTDSDADDLVRWAAINKVKVLLNTPQIRLFRDGLIDETRARRFLESTKLPVPEINEILEFATKMGSRRFINRCVSALRKRFLTGELTLDEVQTELLNAGLNITQTNQMAGSLLCEQRAQGKQPPTSMLCTWLEQGSIDSQQFVERLERIGWERSDALNILVSCQRKINERVAREAKRKAEQERRAMEREQRQAEAEKRKLERARRNAEQQRKKAERVKANRDKLMQRAIARFSKDTELDIDTAGSCVLSLERQLAADTLLTIDERIRTIVLAIEKGKPKDCRDLKNKANQLADQLLEFEQVTEEFLVQLAAS